MRQDWRNSKGRPALCRGGKQLCGIRTLQEKPLGKPSRSECLVTWQAPDGYPDTALVV
jgi:hypothetical protein